MNVSLDEDNPDVDGDIDSPQCPPAGAGSNACFASTVYATPSAYIAVLVASLPNDEALTRDQTLFTVTFANVCDQVWRDEIEQRAPCDRGGPPLPVAGAGRIWQNTCSPEDALFRAVNYIWPAADKQRPTLMVVAPSNAQAKHISTQDVKARAVQNASPMRVQSLENTFMRPGRQQKALAKL